MQILQLILSMCDMRQRQWTRLFDAQPLGLHLSLIYKNDRRFRATRSSTTSSDLINISNSWFVLETLKHEGRCTNKDVTRFNSPDVNDDHSFPFWETYQVESVSFWLYD